MEAKLYINGKWVETTTGSMIDDIIKQLKSFNDKNIRNEIVKNPDLMMQIVKEYFYCG